ncbi:hypothetical protein TWF506_008631 [Arthrobotrys conoides]|uniref:Uncharacterized protein n=1 Tax=Arthrobotrys conoides TaxID=74498 RepID=A0AAN8PG61_9PEZI
MKFLRALTFAASASAAVVFPRADTACNKNNCLNAVIKDQPSLTAERFAACQSFVSSQTITSLVYLTTSSTDTITLTATTTLPAFLGRRDLAIPAWAGNCQSKDGVPAEIRFSSACSCYFKTLSREPVVMPTTVQTITAISSFATTVVTTQTSYVPVPTGVRIKAVDVTRSEDTGNGPEIVPSEELEGAFLKLNEGGGIPTFSLTKDLSSATTFYVREKLYHGDRIGRAFTDTNAQTHQLSIGAPLDKDSDPYLGNLTTSTKPLAEGERPLAWRPFVDSGLEWTEDVVFGEHAWFVYFTEGPHEGAVLSGQGEGFPAGDVMPWQLSLEVETIVT